MLDTRRHLRKFIDATHSHKVDKSLLYFALSFIFAYCVAFIPVYAGMGDLAQKSLFILLFSAALWITEAIPAFSVSLLLIALEIFILGFDNYDFAKGGDWKKYLEPWENPLVFLFFAGFVMAAAATKTKLDVWLAKKVLYFMGNRPKDILIGIMVVTFGLSMFMSNTATVAMMLTVLMPILASMNENNRFKKTLLLSATMSANIGGMGTIIGTPPNAIAVGALGKNAPGFLEWMYLALPPAIILAVVMGLVLYKIYPSNEENIDISKLDTAPHSKEKHIPSWKRGIVAIVFLLTVSLWLSEPLHHIPTTVVSMIPVVAFTVFGIIDVEEIRAINWDVLILIIGGLALGNAVSSSGLAAWFAGAFDMSGLQVSVIVLALSYLVVVISNFMSNTAAANIMLPLVVALIAGIDNAYVVFAVVSVALSASFAMCLPVSTPPNAIVYSSKLLKSKDFLTIGLFSGLVGPLAILLWMRYIL